VVSTPVENRVRPTLGLTVARISRDIREDFQIPLIERVIHAVVTVEDSQVVQESVDKLLKYHADGSKIPPEYLTDEGVLFWAKLKDTFKASGKYDADFLQKIHKIWSLWDDEAIAYEEASTKVKKVSKQKVNLKIKARNKNGRVFNFPYQRIKSTSEGGPKREKEQEQQGSSALDKILWQEIPDPSRTDFDLLLAFAIEDKFGKNFGKEYQTWVNDHPDKGAHLKARQLVSMWHHQFSGDDTPEAMISILQQLPLTKNIIDQIKKLL